MENKEMDSEIFKFKQSGEMITGKVIALFQTETGGVIKLDTEQFNLRNFKKDKTILLRIDTVGLKRIFKQAVLQKDIIVGKTIITVEFLESDNKSIRHFVLIGYRDPEIKKSYFRYSSKQYELVDDEIFLELLK